MEKPSKPAQGKQWQRKIAPILRQSIREHRGGSGRPLLKLAGEAGEGTGAAADTAKHARGVELPAAAPWTGDRRAVDAPAGHRGRPHRPGGRRQRGDLRIPPRPAGPAPPRELPAGHPPPLTAEPSRGHRHPPALGVPLCSRTRSAPLRSRLRRRAPGKGVWPRRPAGRCPAPAAAPAPRRPPPQDAGGPGGAEPAAAAPPAGRRGRSGAGAAGWGGLGGRPPRPPGGRRPAHGARRVYLAAGGKRGLRADGESAQRRAKRPALTSRSPAPLEGPASDRNGAFTVLDLHTMRVGKGRRAFLQALF